MLQAIRDRVMGVVGWIVLGLLIITFAFFGLDSYLQSSAENYAAKVNDVEISPTQHDRNYQQMLTRMRQALGDSFNPDLIDESSIKRNSLAKLINEELILQAADSAGLATSDKQLASQIVSVEEFKQDGEFSKDRYTQVLRYQGMAPKQFEWQLSKEIVANQLKAGIILTASGPEDVLRRAYALQGQLRSFNYMVIPGSAVDDELAVSDQEIQGYYQNHAEQFKTEERVKIQYLEVKSAELEVAQSVDEDQIKTQYAEHGDKYVTPEQRHARHILIVPGSDSEADLATAQSKAAEISSRLDKGADFAALAGELSDDPSSAPAGGDLGTFGKGVMVPEFEEAVFNLKIGERTKPIKSSFGFHIIELLGIVPEVATPIEAVRQELIDELLSSERNALYVDKIDTLTNLAFEQPDSLQDAAAALGLRILESDWISRSGGSGVASNPKVIDAVFADDVLKSGNNSQPVEIGEDHVVVLRVVDHQQAALPPLDDIRDQVTAAARKDKATRLLKTRGDAMLADLVSGKTTMDSSAQALKLKVEISTLMPRNSSQPSPLIVSRAFVLPRAELKKPFYDGFLQPDGGYILLSLEEVRDGNYDDLSEADRKQARRSLNELLGNSEMQMVISELEARAKIRIPESKAQ